ncbi:CIC11C00000003080 [Sungouiella intermedia]|uniref:CIC11C00000003080 n=1 Tax=Sungouiella intermedia TaxID=45354 RepID=A0A1L0DIU5_9ASCO|nr:CIC11C00000003080 [[Candida] intermedia]
MKIIIIGGSYAGHIAFNTLYNNAQDRHLEVTMVSMTSHAYFNVAAPRLLVEPDRFDETIFSNEEFVTKNLRGKGKFVLGKAVAVDVKLQTVKVDIDGTDVILSYDMLVIAVGTSNQFAGFKVHKSHKVAKEAIEDMAHKLRTSKLIAILGGGPTGVETAGEIALNIDTIDVTLYTGRSGPLADYPKLKQGAQQKLTKLGVNIVNGIRVKSVLYLNDKTQVILDDGSTFDYDLVIQAIRQAPLSGFLPESIKDANGYIKTDRHLVVKGTKNVLALGDIVSGSPRTFADLKYNQEAVFAATIKRLLGIDRTAFKRYTAGLNTIYVPMSGIYGEGLWYGMKMPNWLVRRFKSKTFMMENAAYILN